MFFILNFSTLGYAFSCLRQWRYSFIFAFLFFPHMDTFLPGKRNEKNALFCNML